MNILEYEKVKYMNYIEYCDYLQIKYGKSKYDYMTESFDKNPKVTRTKEGLFAHHKFEDHAIMLGHKSFAMRNPFEWQKAENIIYCDYLEHLLLHVLICEYPAKDKNTLDIVGIGGAINFLIPELNDLYSGMAINLEWKSNCFKLVENDLDCYVAIVKRLIKNSSNYPCFDIDKITSSYNEHFGTWQKSRNKKVTNMFFEEFSIYEKQINETLCKEFNVKSYEDFDKIWFTYNYYAFEGEFYEYEVNLSLLIKNFGIYHYAKQIIEEYKQSNYDTLFDYLIQDFCPKNECLGGDLITGEGE